MMNKKDVFFIGIKGTGMASLAKICLNLGYEVSGSDIETHFFTEDSLRSLNVPILTFAKENIKDNTIVVAGNAFLDDHIEIIEAKSNDSIEFYRYHEFLGEIMNNFRSIAVSGSHGKTTTTTLLKDMLETSVDTGYLIGDGTGNLDKDDTYFALEACEFRRHFLAYKPNIAIMTNFEIDHVDYFKDNEDYLNAYDAFSENVKELIIAWGDDPQFDNLKLKGEVWTYGFDKSNDISLDNIIRHTNETEFDLIFKGEKLKHFKLPLVGDHMVLNALAVIGVGIYEKISLDKVEAGLRNFKGALRRYVIDDLGDNIIIDDYAHHPTEIKVTLEATRTRYPDRKIVAIFKPHRVGRVYYFAEEFKEALMLADEVGLCPFTSIDDYEEGIDIDITYLQDKIPGSFIVNERDEDIKMLADLKPAVYVFMSSKNIYDLEDKLKELL
ncbi:MAG: UDP-N-acetylmuramate--L-alanine ligase [Erysipelothrix sp.]|nr:UDP-N-acetylmuramate--L-alanine ligase [Erysipelothrix sp.]